MQIVIELPDETYKDIKEENGIYGINNGLCARITGKVVGAIQSGVPLKDIKAEISEEYANIHHTYSEYAGGLSRAYEIIDKYIDKVDMRGKSCRCNTCKNNDDELSGECYECIKGIFDHYEPQESQG